MSTQNILTIDVGWAYRLTPGPTRLVLASKAASDSWPPDGLLFLTGKKGVFGTLKIDSPQLAEFENDAVELVKSQIDDRTLIVLPEFSGSPNIERRIKKLLDESDKQCIVVAGSYYRTPDHLASGAESVCPILIPHSESHYQQKFVPAPIEKPGFDKLDRRTILVFKNTGFGDFAVLVCSDALDNTSRTKYVDCLRHQIDFLVVPARNPAAQLPEGLQTLANDERWCVLYSNGHKSHPSQVISSYKHESTKCPTVNGCIATIDLNQFQADLKDGHELHRCTDEERVFQPAPRHWPFRGFHAADFSDHLRVMAIGSHFDDVWLGCSGTLMRLGECYNAQIRVVTLCTHYPSYYFGRYNLEGGAFEELDKNLKLICSKLGFEHDRPQGIVFEDQSFPEDRLHNYMKELASRAPHTDILFVPRHDDVHRDHMITSKTAVVEFRGASVLEYEIKDFRRSPFHPNVLVDLSIRSNQSIEFDSKTSTNTSFAEKKAFILENAFSMMDHRKDLPPMFQRDHTLGRMAFRASQSGTELRYAEAFVAEMII